MPPGRSGSRPRCRLLDLWAEGRFELVISAHILATAASAGAKYLVTGDLKLRRLERFTGTAVVLPAEFMEDLH